MKTKLLLFFACISTSLFSVSTVLDYGSRPFTDPFNQPSIYNYWKNAFNKAPELAPFFIQLRNDLKINTAIETGTWETGNTAKFFSYVFENVDTIEINPTVFQKAKLNLQQFVNIKCYNGSSDVVLNQILPNYVNQPILFYLDAHWYTKWPLLDELDAISVTHYDNCVIVIDDFKVPDRPDFSFDSYGNNECSFEYIMNKLNNVFSEYDSYYLLPAQTYSRAKFVALPKKWNFKPNI